MGRAYDLQLPKIANLNVFIFFIAADVVIINIFQGEVIDLYLKEDKKMMILISSFIQVGVVFAAILGTELFVAGGWVLVGFGIASFNILPLLVLPFLKNREAKNSCGQKVNSTNMEPQESTDGSKSICPQPISIWSREIAFYFPDVVLLLNNAVCDLIAYVLPARILYSTATISLNSAVKIMRIFSTVSLISALTLSFIAGRIEKFNFITTMAIGNFFYHIGAVMAFGATTCDFKFFDFTYQVVIGLVLMGLGEACHANLYTPSKFYFYEKWNLNNSGLGERAAKIYNIVLSVSSILGTVLSALSLTEESEIPTIAVISGLGVFLTLGLFLCNLVK